MSDEITLDAVIEKVRIHNLKDGDLLVFTLRTEDSDLLTAQNEMNQYAERIVGILDNITEHNFKFTVLVVNQDMVDLQVIRKIGEDGWYNEIEDGKKGG